MKNLLFFSTILLTSAGAFAQLSVKPNGAADSYVYVKDQILFVTEDIALSRNGVSNNQEASIYLRENGQLIQGNPLALNSGDGQLSVQQNSPVTNAFAYYYWCSPIGNTRTPANVATPPGNRNFGVGHLYEPLPQSVTAARLSNTTTGRDGIINPMTISTRWLYTHKLPGDEAEANYQRMNSGNNAPAGYGFTMKGLGTGSSYDQNYEFRGRPNNGDFEIPVAGPVSGVAQMTLTGNPYPSALDLNKLFYEPGNEALGQINYYDEDRTAMTHNYSGKPFGYGVWIPDGEDNTPNNPLDFEGLYTAATFYIWNAAGNHGGSGTNGTGVNNKRYAPIGQGFMFVGKNTSPANVTIKNSHRVFVKEGAATNSVFQRPEGNDETVSNMDLGPTLSSIPTSTDTRTPQTRIYAIFNEALTRDMLLVFSDQATDGYDRGMDGLSPLGMASDAYFPVGNDNDRLPYVINSVNYAQNKQIPIAFKIKNQTKFEVKVVEEIKKPYTHAYIFDSVENTYQQITRGQSASFNLPTGTYDNRFFVVFRSPFEKRDIPNSELENTALVQKNVTFFQNNPVRQLEVNNPEGYTLKSASVYDMSGKLVISESNLGDSNKYSFYTGNLSSGVYLVKLITADNIAIDYKAIVHNQ